MTMQRTLRIFCKSRQINPEHRTPFYAHKIYSLLLFLTSQYVAHCSLFSPQANVFCMPYSFFFSLIYGDNTIASEELQIEGICSALRVFEQGGIFSVPCMLLHGVSISQSHPKYCPNQSPFMTHKEKLEIYSNSNVHSVASYDT
jgi:hypothetical protein